MERSSQSPRPREHARRGATAPPPEARNQATRPPGNPPVDEDAVAKSRERLEQATGEE